MSSPDAEGSEKLGSIELEVIVKLAKREVDGERENGKKGESDGLILNGVCGA